MNYKKILSLIVLLPTLGLGGCATVKTVERIVYWSIPVDGAPRPICELAEIVCLEDGREEGEELIDALHSEDPKKVRKARREIIKQAKADGALDEEIEFLETASNEELIAVVEERLAYPDCDDIQSDAEC